MSLGLHDSERRYRQRFRKSLVKSAALVGVVSALAVFAYQIGVERMKAANGETAARAATLARENALLEDRLRRVAAAAREARARVAKLEARYAAEVPTGDVARLAGLVRNRIAEGVAPERLEFAIANVRNERDCTPAETKRFVVATPLYRGGNTSVSFAGGTVTATARGTPARDPSNRAEAWFDPAAPVTLTFAQLDGSQTEASGVLPLHHSVVVADAEYRFAVRPGERSFVEVTADRCAFP